MADKTSVPTSVPVSAPKSQKYHWWYDAKAAGVRNSPPANIAASPPTSFGLLSQSPATAAGIPIVGRVRKDSLKNMVHLCDFATP